MTVICTEEDFQYPVLQYSGKLKKWILKEDYVFEWGTALVRERVTVFATFSYNKADVPWVLQKLIPSDKEMEACSLPHDAMCREKGVQTPGVWMHEIMIVSEGVWKQDQSRWKRWETDDFCGFMAKCAGVKLAAGVAPALKLNPINWFKMF